MAGIMTNLELKPAVAAARSEMYAATLCRPSYCDACSKKQISPQTIVGSLCSMQSLIWYFDSILLFVPAPGKLLDSIYFIIDMLLRSSAFSGIHCFAKWE